MAGLINDMQLPLLIRISLSNYSLDQLSIIWTALSKCQNNIRDGFRLENLSWRLWYKTSIIEKRQRKNIIEDIVIPTPAPTVNRSRSLPDLTQWSQQPSTAKKFFIEDNSISFDNNLDSDEDQLTFTKKQPSVKNSPSNSTSLLSNMLQYAEPPSSSTSKSGLRRCKSRYSHLNQLVSAAN